MWVECEGGVVCVEGGCIGRWWVTREACAAHNRSRLPHCVQRSSLL